FETLRPHRRKMCTSRHEGDVGAGRRQRCPEGAANTAGTDHCDPHRLALTLMLAGWLQLPASTRALSRSEAPRHRQRLLASHGFAQHAQIPIEAKGPGRAWQVPGLRTSEMTWHRLQGATRIAGGKAGRPADCASSAVTGTPWRFEDRSPRASA